MKETLTKVAILIGVPKCIEAGFAFDPTVAEGDRDDAFVRRGFQLDKENEERGREGMRRVYQHNLEPIDVRYGDLHEFRKAPPSPALFSRSPYLRSC
jgi:hypothetical protein